MAFMGHCVTFITVFKHNAMPNFSFGMKKTIFLSVQYENLAIIQLKKWGMGVYGSFHF